MGRRSQNDGKQCRKKMALSSLIGCHPSRDVAKRPIPSTINAYHLFSLGGKNQLKRRKKCNGQLNYANMDSIIFTSVPTMIILLRYKNLTARGIEQSPTC